MDDNNSTLLDLENPQGWPQPLAEYLGRHHRLFLDWEQRDGDVSPRAYDAAIVGLMQLLRQYIVRGWHCTRLTDDEINIIERHGMDLPNAEMLARRIDAVAAKGGFTAEVAGALKAKNQADEQYRKGMLWFCFFSPSLQSDGVSDFFRYWGGEALYNSHDRNPLSARIIGKVGTPCIVEADVPIAFFKAGEGLAFKIVRRFLISRGFETCEPVDHEDKIVRPLPASAIRRVIRFPSPEFKALSGCEQCEPPLS